MQHCMGRLATLEADMGHVKGAVDDIKSTVGHIDEAIRGNDGLGLAARTSSLEESRDEQDDTQRSNRRWLKGILASLIVGTLIVLFRGLTK